MARIFVSHAAADKAFADAFVERVLLLGCGVPRTSVFYSSGADTGIPIGADLNSVVRDRISENDTLVVALISPTFLSRPYCVAELGAAWSRAGSLFPLCVPELERASLDGVLNGLVVKSVDDPAGLDELYERIATLLPDHAQAGTWNEQRAKWLAEIPRQLKNVVDRRGIELVSAAACSREDGHMEVFWTNGSSEVSCRWWLAEHGWSRIEPMQNTRADHLAAVSADGEEMLFGVKGVDRVWVRRWAEDARGWVVAGEPTWIEGTVRGPLTAIARGWQVELFAWTEDSKPCHLWREGDGWTKWTTRWAKEN